MLANALHGAGYTPLYTLAIAYIEENENFQLAGFHVGASTVTQLVSM